jgi:hypothetical protein
VGGIQELPIPPEFNWSLMKALWFITARNTHVAEEENNWRENQKDEFTN